jgi:DNA-binding CsgD family transcriptional regulator
LSRSQVAKRLGVSIGTVRNLEKAGHLRPSKANGVNLFDPKEVAALRGARDREHPGRALRRDGEGEIAARCFDLFAEGKSVRDVVRELRLTPATARALRREYIAGDVDPRPPPSEEDDDALEADERRWRADQDRVFTAWEKAMRAGWRRARRG